MKRSSPALVISLIALFVSLGGTSYAITTLDDNSVTTAKIKDGAVTTPKLATGAVDQTKLKLDSVGSSQLKEGAVKLLNIYDGSVDSAKIKDGSVGIADLQGNAFGDLTSKQDTMNSSNTTQIRVVIDPATADPARWTAIDSMQLGAGAHLLLVTADVLIGRDTSDVSDLYCAISKGVPDATGSTVLDRRKIHVSPDSFVSERLLLISPVSGPARVGLYCRLLFHDPDSFVATIKGPRWNAIHLTGTHSPSS